MKKRRLTKPSLFVVEGPDACGKTTFALELAATLGAIYWHMTCTKLLAVAMTDYQLNAVENVDANLRAGRHVVLDRHWPSEHCYGSHLRKETMIDVNPVCAALTELDPTYIFCMDPDGAKAAADRHELHLDPAHPYEREDFLAIYRNYHKLIHDMREEGEPVHVRKFLPRLDIEADRDFIVDMRAHTARRKEEAK